MKFQLSKLCAETRGLDSFLKQGGKGVLSGPAQFGSPTCAQSVRENIYVLFYQSGICAMATRLHFTSKYFTTPQQAFV